MSDGARGARPRASTAGSPAEQCWAARLAGGVAVGAGARPGGRAMGRGLPSEPRTERHHPGADPGQGRQGQARLPQDRGRARRAAPGPRRAGQARTPPRTGQPPSGDRSLASASSPTCTSWTPSRRPGWSSSTGSTTPARRTPPCCRSTAPTAPRTCSPPTSPRRWCARCARSGAGRSPGCRWPSRSPPATTSTTPSTTSCAGRSTCSTASGSGRTPAT